ncbi:hypothetical protein EVAR_40442_1 [Eumeta japonica]|uniref:Uncharacterized protein n=1 Tax=Eumeta variegata TaxID=151549 RepID=A0A4C1WYL8_EUMVA|nr:hypothetical protein EVAR_40442_1 [Eumeta japonica]
MSMMAAVASRPHRPDNSSKSGALGNLRFARAALENRLLTRQSCDVKITSTEDMREDSSRVDVIPTSQRYRPSRCNTDFFSRVSGKPDGKCSSEP